MINIALEGMLLTGAFFAVLGADVTGSWFLGVLVGMVAGGLMALIHAVFSVSLRADQIVSGTALNFLAVGITTYLYLNRYGAEGTPTDLPQVPDVHRNQSSFANCRRLSCLLRQLARCWQSCHPPAP